ncbi:hypothetical protein V5N11_024812 [Cardamine amara subsp. amara]|uniref:Uncharacterized protein n=1 Tax=Cardamine amara subsp. amara TaxID=228776 RepID=A0ABD0ZQX6_CARAN
MVMLMVLHFIIKKTYSEAARGSGLITDEDRIVYLLAFGLSSSDSLDKMLTVAARVLALNGSQSSVVVTRNSFTIVEDRVKIVKDDAKWQELLIKANKIDRASSSMSSAALQVDVQAEGAALDSMYGV